MSTITPVSDVEVSKARKPSSVLLYHPVAARWITRLVEAMSLLAALLWSLEATAAAEHRAGEVGGASREPASEVVEHRGGGQTAQRQIKTSIDLIDASALPSTSISIEGSRSPSSVIENKRGNLSFIETQWKPHWTSGNASRSDSTPGAQQGINSELIRRSENTSASYSASPCFAYSSFVILRFGQARKQD